MGFIQALRALGQMVPQAETNPEMADIANFLALPHPLGEPEERRAHVIRVWLKARDVEAESLEIEKVLKIDRVEYPSARGEGELETQVKQMYLFRKPVGANVNWRFSPLDKLGKGVSEAEKELLGSGWEQDYKARYNKLRNKVLYDYEDSGFMQQGSVARIMEGLFNMVSTIIGYWDDKKRSYILVFGLECDGKFMYPGEVKAFREYFRYKMRSQNKGALAHKDKKEVGFSQKCSLCGKTTDNPETLDKVFPFSTFDKKNFMPGLKDIGGIKEKVFPICQECFSFLSAGKARMEERFTDFRTIPGTNLYIVPEVISDSHQYLRSAADHTREFLKNGVKTEQNVFENLSRHNEGLVLHFMLAEQNQAQLVIHCLVEDVPPSRLARLQGLWSETCTIFEQGRIIIEGRTDLDRAIRQTVSVLFSLAGKTEQDKTVMKEKSIDVVGRLLNGETVNTGELKALMVSRFPGLFNDSDWLNPKKESQLPGKVKVRGMAEIIDFLNRSNRR